MVSTSDLLQQMHQSGTVLAGWDAVLNLSEAKVNELLAQQFHSAPPVWRQITLGFCQLFGDNVGYTAVSFTLQAPLLQWLSDQANAVRVTFAVDGEVKTAAKAAPADFDPRRDCNVDDPALSWQVANTLTAQPMTADVPVTQVQGLLHGQSNTISVVLDFPNGSFQTPFSNDPQVDGQLVQEIRNYFATHDIRYPLLSVDLAALNQNRLLTPTSFRINTLTTNSGKNILQLFVATVSPAPAQLTINVTEPIPDGFDCSLLISQQLAFNQIIVPMLDLSRLDSLFFLPADGSYSGSVQYSLVPGLNPGVDLNYTLTVMQGSQSAQLHAVGYLPLILSGTGQKQVIQIDTQPVFTGKSIDNPSGFPGNVVDQLDQIFMWFSQFENRYALMSFSVFALETLLFPANNVLQLQQVFVPSDLLILGQVQVSG